MLGLNHRGYGYGYGEDLENKIEHHDDPEPVVDIHCIYTDILLNRFFNKKTKRLIVAGVRAIIEKYHIAKKKFSSSFLEFLKVTILKKENSF